MTDNELIANQAREINELKLEALENKKMVDDIYSLLFSIGAPLNDGCFKYTNEQLKPFAEISKALRL